MLPEDVRDYIDQIRKDADEKKRSAEQEAEESHHGRMYLREMFLTEKVFPLVPEPLRQYLHYDETGSKPHQGQETAILEVPGLAPVAITVDAHIYSGPTTRYGVHRFKSYFWDDDKLEFEYASAKTLEEALEMAVSLPDRETATAKARAVQEKRAAEQKAQNDLNATPLRLAEQAAARMGIGDHDAAQALALMSIAYSLALREE